MDGIYDVQYTISERELQSEALTRSYSLSSTLWGLENVDHNQSFFSSTVLSGLELDESQYVVAQAHMRLSPTTFLVNRYTESSPFGFSLWLAALGGLAGVIGTLFNVLFPTKVLLPRTLRGRRLFGQKVAVHPNGTSLEDRTVDDPTAYKQLDDNID